MERIQCPKKSKLKKEKAKKGQVTIRNKKNGKEARVTLQLNIPGVPNPRLEIYGATEVIARKKLAELKKARSEKLRSPEQSSIGTEQH